MTSSEERDEREETAARQYMACILEGGDVASAAWFIRAAQSLADGYRALVTEICEDCEGSIPSGATPEVIAAAIEAIMRSGAAVCRCCGVKRMHGNHEALAAHGIDDPRVEVAPPGERLLGERAD